MNEEKKELSVPEEAQEEQLTRRFSYRRRVMMLMLMFALTLVPSALAEGEVTGMAAVSAQSDAVVTWVTAVFNMITGNAYLATLMAFGLVAAAIRLFRKSKRAAR